MPYAKGETMDLTALIDEIRALPDFSKIGMILCHVGVVRAYSRDGRRVSGLKLSVDRQALDEILVQQQGRPGIMAVRVEIQEGSLQVGDVIMHLVVAGDIRDRVIPVLEDTLNAIKKQVTKKTEFFVDP
jgi:molybdopterin synthase catalytic subunit